MKNKLLFLLLIAGMTVFGQDLKLEINNAYLWNVTTPTPQDCAIQLGYDATGAPKTQLIRIEYDITNWGTSDVSFPASQVWYNPCREQKEVIGLITQQVLDKCGRIIHSHLDGMKVGDFGHNYYFKDPTQGCVKTLDIYPTNFDQLPDSVFGLSALHFHRSNSYPSGYQLGIASSYLPAVADTYQIKSFLNIPYINQGDNCNSDTATGWYYIDAANNVFQKASAPSCTQKISPPCVVVGMSKPEQNGNTFCWTGSTCNAVQVIINIVKGNTVKNSTQVWGNGPCVTLPILSLKDLRDLWGGGSYYQLIFKDGVNQWTVEIKK